MAKKKTSNEGDLSPQQQAQIQESQRLAKLKELVNLASKFTVGARVNKRIWVKDPTEDLRLVKGYKTGKIAYTLVDVLSGYPILFVLWDGDKVPVPEHPPLLAIEDW